MPDSIKISALPILSSVRAGDILPVVDENITQTSRCTAAQIAAIGGGPPGDGTVTTAKIVNGAVTAAKTSFSATDKILGRASSGAGNGEEITCTSWARGLLACISNSAALTYLSNLVTFASATFTGTSTFSGPIQANSTLTVTGASTLSGGASVTGTLATTGNATVSGTLAVGGVPSYFCRAWFSIRIYGGTASINASGNVTSITKNFVGSYTVNFSTAMPDANYVFVGGNDSGQAYHTVGWVYSASNIAFWVRSSDTNVGVDGWGLSGGGTDTDINVNGAVIR